MKFLKITKENSKVHIIWGFICIFVGLFSMMAVQWHTNKYEVLMASAAMTTPSIINKRALQAANRWEEICSTRPAELRAYVDARMSQDIKKMINDSNNNLTPENRALLLKALPKR